MSQALHANARRVQDLLSRAGSQATVVQLADSTRTSAEAAAALGVEVGQIGKSVVLLAGGAPVVVVASGPDRVDTDAVAARFGGAAVTRPDAPTVRDATGYPIGGVSPVGLPPGVPVLVDRALERYSPIWVAAGHPHAVFRTDFAELVGLCGGEVGDFRQI